MYFTATDGTTGEELWAVDLADLGVALAEPFGRGCLGRRGFPEITSSGVPNVGSTSFSVDLAYARSNAPAVLLIGTTRLGAGLGNGCTLYTIPLVDLVATTDVSGRLQLPLAIPRNPSLEGQKLFLQYTIIDQPYGAYNMLLSLSDGLLVLVGGG